MMGLIGLISVLTAAAPGTVHADGGFAKVGTFGGQLEKLVRSPRSEALGGADMATASGSFATLANTSPLPEGNWIGASYGGFYYLSDTKIDSLGSAFENGPWRLSAVGARFPWLLNGQDIRWVKCESIAKRDQKSGVTHRSVWLL